MSWFSDFIGTTPERTQAVPPAQTLEQLTEARIGLLPQVMEAQQQYVPQMTQLQIAQQQEGALAQQQLTQQMGYAPLQQGIQQGGMAGLGAGLQPMEQGAMEQFAGLGATPQELQAMQAYQTGLGQAMGQVEAGAPGWMQHDVEQAQRGAASARGLGYSGMAVQSEAQALARLQQEYRLPYMQMAQQYAGGLAGLGAGVEQRRLGGLGASADIAARQRQAESQGFGQAMAAYGTAPQLGGVGLIDPMTWGGLGQQPAYIPPSETGGGGILSGILGAGAGAFAGGAGYGLAQRYF